MPFETLPVCFAFFLIKAETSKHVKCNILSARSCCFCLNGDYKPNTVEATIEATETTTFKLRYFKNDNFFQKGGSLFVYIGGQYSLDKLDPSNLYLLDQIAPNFTAKIVVLEHRFYGQSNPYGDDPTAFTDINKIQNLNISMVLEDIYAVVKQESVGMADEGQVVHPVLFGVGYAGLLAGFYSKKFQMDNEKKAIAYDANLIAIFTDQFGCNKSAIKDSFQALRNYDPLKYSELQTIFGLSATELGSPNNQQVWQGCAQYPAQVFCNSLNTNSVEPKDKVEALKNALFEFGLKNTLEHRVLSENEINAKTWQHCSQLVYGKCAATQFSNDNFGIPCTPDLLDYTKDRCSSMVQAFGLIGYDPNLHYQPDYIAKLFGQDLFGPNTCDPDSIAEARTQIVEILDCWIRAANPPKRCFSTGNFIQLTHSGIVEKQDCDVCNKGWPWRDIKLKDDEAETPVDPAKPVDTPKKPNDSAETSDELLIDQLQKPTLQMQVAHLDSTHYFCLL
uniref:Uncharacterized protein n=1 Tax=Ditylenchus dipsaci TaxID=166011 RepID=A0A915ERM7_9BILA